VIQIVRRRVTADLDACVAALAEVHAADGYPMRWPADPVRWLRPDLPGWVADLDGRVVGHVLLESVDDGATLSRLFVTPAGRGRRLGEQLIAAALDAATARSLAVTLEVVDSGAAAIALYRRLGWRHTGTGPGNWLTPDGTPPTVHYFAAPRQLPR
jgi:ribosomal protein S18 acetylase RimI-like enzyme